MFSSNPFPCFLSSSSSSYPPHLPFLDPDTSFAYNSLLHDPLSVPFIPTTINGQIPESVANLAVADSANSVPYKQDENIGAHYDISNYFTKKSAPSARKDRHRKICTSQGFRDRRVRLSIEIARKFFDLQDMLGFDKASNTLEWLFTNSKKAIKELARSRYGSSEGAMSFSSSFSDECEVVSGTNQLAAESPNPQVVVVDSNNKSLVGVGGKERKLKRGKESREKARAKARERDGYLKKKYSKTANPPILLNQMRQPIEPEACERSPEMVQLQPQLENSEAAREDFNVIEESIVIKTKLKPSNLMASQNQNLVNPKEASFNNNNNNEYYSNPNLPPNWEADGTINGCSSFWAIAGMNLSTEIPWEECTSHRPQEYVSFLNSDHIDRSIQSLY